MRKETCGVSGAGSFSHPVKVLREAETAQLQELMPHEPRCRRDFRVWATPSLSPPTDAAWSRQPRTPHWSTEPIQRHDEAAKVPISKRTMSLTCDAIGDQLDNRD